MSDEELGDAPIAPSATKIPLEDGAALGDPAAVEPAAARHRRRGGRDRQLGRGHPPGEPAPAGALAGVPRRRGLLLWWIVCALFGRVIAPYDPVTGSLTEFNQAPSGAHWFGTDSLGRDVLPGSSSAPGTS